MDDGGGAPAPGRRAISQRPALVGLELTLFAIVVALAGLTGLALVLGAAGLALVLVAI
jgi:hypothetical protein